MEIASLVMSVDARPVKKASEELSNFTKQAATTEKAVDGVSDALTDAAKAAGVYRDASGKLREANGRLITEARKIELGLDAVSENANKASKSVKGLGDGAGSASTYLKTMATAAVAAFSVAAIVEFTRRTSVAIAEIERFAQLSNTTNEQFQKAAYAAARFGVEQEKLSDILKDTNDKFGDFFQTGAGPLADFFEQIAPRVGITADAFRGLSGADALGLYVKTLEQAGVNQQDMTFYLEALASDATLLQGVFKDGGAALAAYSAEAENLGIILSDQTITQAREFQNQLASVNAILGNAGKTITAEMLPALSAITTMFMNAIKESGGMGNAVSNAVDKSVRALAFILDAADAVTRVFGVIGRAGVVAFLALKSGAMDVAASIIEGPLDALNYLIRGFNELGQYIGTTFNEIEPPKFAQGLRQEAADAAAAARIGMDDIQSILMEPLAGRTFIDLYEQAQQVGASLEVAGAAATNATVPFKRLGEEAGSASKEVVKLNKAVADGDHDAAAKAVEDYRKEVEQLEDRLDPVGKATKQYQKDVALLASAHARGEISGEKYATMLAALEGEYAKATEVSGEWAQWTESALERVDGAFADAWKNIGDGFSGFRDSLTNAFKQMLAELAHMAITRPIVMQIGAALGIGGMQSGGQGLLGSLLGGGGGSGGGGIMDLFNAGKTAFSVFNSGFGQAISAGWGSGGLSGAISGGFNYGSGAIGGLFGAGGAVNSAAAGATQAGYAGSQFSNWTTSQNYAAGNYGYAGPIMAGIGGALQGYQQAGLKGAATGAAGGVGGFYGGAYIGTMILPGIGTVVGAALGSILGGKLGSSIWGGDWVTKNSGLTAEVSNGGFGSFRYIDEEKKGGLFGSDKKRTKYTPIEQETNQALNDTYDAVELSVVDLFESLSYDVTEEMLSGINIARANISTQGKSSEEIEKAIAEWFEGAAESINTQLSSALNTGLNLDFAGMQKFVGNLLGVNEVLRYLDVEMYEASVSGGKLAESLSAAAGGLEALAKNSQTYYDAFFTQAEKTEDTIDAIKRAFAAADVELVSSREAYRAAVEAIDLTSESGQEMFATMMALSGQAAAYFDILEAKAEQAKQAELQAQQVALQAQQALINGLLSAIRGSVDTAYSALQRAVAEQQAQISESIGRVNANISDLTAIGSALDSAFKQLRGNSEAATKAVRAHAVMTLNSALVSARAGSSLAGFSGLQDALDVASQMDTELYASLVDFEREQGRTANLIDELQGINSKQLSAEQQMLRALQDQQNKLNEDLKTAQDQLDALNGIDGSVKSVADAVKAMNDAVVAALSTVADGMAMLNTGKNNSTLIDTLYKTILGRDADAAGKAYWENQLQSGALDYDQIAVAIGNAATQNKNESMTGQSSANDYLIKTVQSAYNTILGRSADQAGVDYWVSQLISGAIAGDQLYQALANGALASAGESEEAKKSAGQWLGLPGFETGGDHSGGYFIAGEKGPEVVATGPSRIFNAGQTADMLSGGSQADEVAAMRAEMTDALRAIAKHTQQTARRVEYLERWDFDGLPEQRAAV